MADTRDKMLWPAVALVVTQVVHGAAPVDENHAESESWLGLVVGRLLLLLAVVGRGRAPAAQAYGRPIAAWTGLAVASASSPTTPSPWSGWFTNPYLGQAGRCPGVDQRGARGRRRLLVRLRGPRASCASVSRGAPPTA